MGLKVQSLQTEKKEDVAAALPEKPEALLHGAEDQYDDVDPEKVKKWRKWQRGWDIPVVKDGRPWGRLDARAREADYESKKEIMDESDLMLQKALSHRQRSTSKTSRNDVLNDMQNELVKPKYRVWNGGPQVVKDPKIMMAKAAEEAKKVMKNRLQEVVPGDGREGNKGANNGRYPRDPNIRRDPKPFMRNLGRGGGGGGVVRGGGPGAAEMSNELDGRFDQRRVRAPVVEHGDDRAGDLRAVLGGFDTEGYLAPQRMLKGQGDPMRAFQFNQVASDGTHPDRQLTDFRDAR